MDLFTPFECRDVTARNRIMLSPMCQYTCDPDGMAKDWHLVHLGARAAGGAGIVMTEATAVDPVGRVSPNDLGIWSDEHAAALERVPRFCKAYGAVPAIQLEHAGRKASKTRPADGSQPLHDERGWTPVAPTDEPWPYDDPMDTHRLSTDEVGEVVDQFVAAAERAVEIGFEIIEIHGAHGYLAHEFYSPVTNDRTDRYGGDFEGRTRFLREVARGIRGAIPDGMPLFVRISATDWLPDQDSWTPEDARRLAGDLGELGVDLIDVSAGGIHPDQQLPEARPHYQVPFAETVAESDVRVGTVGKITTPEGADEVISNGRADLAVIGRKMLRDPHFPIRAARALGHEAPIPREIQRGFE